MHGTGGFTLIELVVAMAVAAILAALAYPSFQGPVLKARRSEGTTALLQLQMLQERWRSEHARYAGTPELASLGPPALSHYSLAITAASSTGYELTATATGAQAADLACKVLRLTVADGTTRHTAGPDAATVYGAADSKRCWNT